MASVSRLDLAFSWVTDLEHAVGWYEAVLGVTSGVPAGDWHSFRLPARPTFALHRAVADGSSGTVIGFRVPDVDVAIAELRTIGIDPVGSITDTGRLRFVEYEDPDGNRLQLIERLHSPVDTDRFRGMVAALADAWGRQDIEAAIDCFTDDAVYMEPPDEQLFQGRDELRRYFAPLQPGTYLRADALWFDEDRQSGAIEFTFGVAGKEDADHGVAIVDVADGRIARWREYVRRGPADLAVFNATSGKHWKWTAENYP